MTNVWTFHKLLQDKINAKPGDFTAKLLMTEIKKLNIQQCPYCDGFGHGGSYCPTDTKLASLRLDRGAQTACLNTIRAELEALKQVLTARTYS